MGEPSQAPQEVHAQSLSCKSLGVPSFVLSHVCLLRMVLMMCSGWQVLPLMRVKKLMKEEADVKAVAGDASYAAARATVSVHSHRL